MRASYGRAIQDEINRLNLREVDLNLLVILDVLLEERKVSGAARRLGLSQSSTSGALDRCRKLFGDALLIRTGRGLALTQRAQELRKPIRSLLEQTQALLGAQPQDLATSSRTVRIIASDMPAQSVLLMLWRSLQECAPHINLVVLPWRESNEVLDLLARGEADLAIAVLPQAGHGFRRTELLSERYCIAMRPEHPAAHTLDLDAWLRYPHVIASAKGARRTPLDDQLALLGRTRRVGIVVPSFLMVPTILRSSDLIAMVPCQFKKTEPDLLYLEPPIAVEGFSLHLAMARRCEGDVAVQLVAKLIRKHYSLDVPMPEAPV